MHDPYAFLRLRIAQLFEEGSMDEALRLAHYLDRESLKLWRKHRPERHNAAR